MNGKVHSIGLPELIEQCCKEFGLYKYTVSYDEMLVDRAIDVIYTPDSLHLEHITMEMEA